MKVMNRNQQGFSTVEGLLIFVIVGLIGGVGWYIYHTKNNNATSNTPIGNSTNITPKVNNDQAKGTPITVSGKVACMGRSSVGLQSDLCQVVLRTDKGDYAIDTTNDPADTTRLGTGINGIEFTVTGTLIPATNSQTIGIIEVSSIKQD